MTNPHGMRSSNIHCHLRTWRSRGHKKLPARPVRKSHRTGLPGLLPKWTTPWEARGQPAPPFLRKITGKAEAYAQSARQDGTRLGHHLVMAHSPLTSMRKSPGKASSVRNCASIGSLASRPGRVQHGMGEGPRAHVSKVISAEGVGRRPTC